MYDGRFFTQEEFIRKYNESHREEFNPKFFERDNQEIIDAVKKIVLSCERNRYFTLKVMEMNEIYDYEEIYNTLRNHEEKRRKKNSPENPYDFINIKDSDIMLLEVKYFIQHNGVEKQETEDKTLKDFYNPWTILQVLIALPRFSRKYFFRLNGNYYTSTFQVVDGSTYNNTNVGNNSGTKKADGVTFKTMFMSVRIFRITRDLVDVNTKTVVRHTVYTSTIFNTHITTMFYLLANYGMVGTFDFLDIHCIRVQDAPVQDPNWYSFEKYGVYVCYPKVCGQDAMVQSLAATIIEGIHDKEGRAEDLYDIRYWIKNLGKCYKNNSIDKGLFVLDSIDGIYDLITKEDLHLPDDKKGNIYQILRWIMREFTYLKNKSNVDITLKRMRLAEYIAHTYAIKLSGGIRRISDMGKGVTLKSIIKSIYTAPMYIINQIINMSNLVSYRDLVNDNDATLALKYTYKGISGLGEDGSSVQKLYRYVNPTQAGIVDLDSSTDSDPGMSGIFCPMGKLYPDYSFTDYQEPDFWEENQKKYQTEYFQQAYPNAISPVSFTGPIENEYEKLRPQVIEESLNITKTICPIYSLDGSVDYSAHVAKLEEDRKEMADMNEMYSLFMKKEDDSNGQN